MRDYTNRDCGNTAHNKLTDFYLVHKQILYTKSEFHLYPSNHEKSVLLCFIIKAKNILFQIL
jgi:hypothetical protein